MRVLLKFIIIFAFLYLNSCSHIVNSPALSSFLDSIPNASVGLCIKEVKTGRVVEEYNSGKSLRPASVLKLVTTATALDLLKSNYKFKTSVGYSGKVERDALNGVIVIDACGDPTWNSKYFPDNDVIDYISSRIKEKRIKSISKGFTINNLGINGVVPRTWTWEDIANYYGSPSHSINIFDNTYEIKFTSGKDSTLTKIKSISPFLKNIKFENKVVASKENSDNAWIFGSPNSNKRVIKGSIPENRKSFIIKGALPNPAMIFTQQLSNKLNKDGVRCKSIISSKTQKTNKILFDIESPELKDIVYYTNQKSVNLYAESIGKHLLIKSGEKSGFDYKPTNFFKDYWKAKGLNVDGIEMVDLCGLSGFNTVTSEFMTDLLIYMSKNSNEGFYFVKSLPLAGNSGTLKNFGKGTSIENNLRAKTGSMKGVRAYCGYFNKGDKLMAFTLIVNNYSCDNKKLINFISNFLKQYCN